MAQICLQECLDAISQGALTPYDSCKIETVVWGDDVPIFFRCDLDLGTITDASSYKAAIEAGTIVLMPCATFSLGEPTQDTAGEKDACGGQCFEEPVTPISYSTFRARKDGTDEDFWCEWNDKKHLFKLAWTKCGRDKLYLPIDQAKAVLDGGTATGLGFNFSSTKAVFGAGPNGVYKKGQWKWSGEIEGCYRSITVEGLADAIADANPSTGG